MSSQVKFKVLTLYHLMPLTFQFTMSLWSSPKYYISLLLTVLDIIYNSSNIAKNWQFIFSYVQVASILSALYIWQESDWKRGWERIGLVSMQATYIASKIKHNDVYHQDINYNCSYLLHYTYNKHCNQYGFLLTVL